MLACNEHNSSTGNHLCSGLIGVLPHSINTSFYEVATKAISNISNLCSSSQSLFSFFDGTGLLFSTQEVSVSMNGASAVHCCSKQTFFRNVSFETLCWNFSKFLVNCSTSTGNQLVQTSNFTNACSSSIESSAGPFFCLSF